MLAQTLGPGDARADRVGGAGGADGYSRRPGRTAPRAASAPRLAVRESRIDVVAALIVALGVALSTVGAIVVVRGSLETATLASATDTVGFRRR